MTSLRRKLVAVFFAVVFLVAAVVLPGCKQDQPAKPKTPAKSKVPADLQ